MPDQNSDPTVSPTATPTDTPAFPPQDTATPPMESPTVPAPDFGSSDVPPAPPIIESAGEAPPGSAAPSFDISTAGGGEPKKKFGGKRVIATILGLLVLVGGLGAGVILVKQQQDIRQRAKIPGEPTSTPTATRPPTPPTSTPTATATPAGNACTRAGGQCYTANNCTFTVGKSPVNGGSGCGNVNQVCCQPGGVSTTAPPPPCTSGYQCQGIANQNECVLNRKGLWQNCSGAGGTGTGLGTCCVPTGATAAPTTNEQPGERCANLGGKCVEPEVAGNPDRPEYYCDKLGQQSCPANEVCIKCAGGGGGGTGTSTPTPTTTNRPGGGVTAQCFNIRAFDTSWNELSTSDLTKLKAGDKIRFTIGGNSSSGSFDKAKFKVNGADRPIVTTKKPNSQDFYDEYTIPAGTTSFTINAQIHHSALGWSK